jgi:cytochrome P450
VTSPPLAPPLDPPRYFLSCARSLGPLADVWDGTTLLSDPADIGFVLRQTGDLFSRMSDALGDPILEDCAGDWDLGRKVVFAGLRRAIEGGVYTATARAFDRLFSRWPDGPVSDGLQRFERATGSIIGEIAFASDAEPVIAIAAQLLDRLLLVARIQYSPPRQAALNSQIKLLERTLQTSIRNLVMGRRKNPRSDLASYLIDPALGNLDVNLATRMLESVLLAGYGVPALALSWAIVLLDRHPHEHSLVRREVDESAIEAGDNQLPLTRAAIQEALRLYPPTWLVGRRLNRSTVIRGRTFEAGHRFYMSSYIVSRDDRYFDNPHSFEPSRWTDDRTARLPRYVYFPFGAGSRICLGHLLATLEVKLLLALIMQDDSLKVAHPEEVRVDSKRGLRPVHLTLIRAS